MLRSSLLGGRAFRGLRPALQQSLAAVGARVPAAMLSSSTSSTSSTPTPAAPSSPSGKPSFIARVAAGGADLLLGAFVSTGTRFDRNLEGLTVKEIRPGFVLCEFTVNEGLSNAYSTLHGGATATIVDVVTTMALLTQDPTRAGVSVDLNVSYLSAAKVGEKVMVEARVLRSGKKLGFTECMLYKLNQGKAGEGGGEEKVLIATGRHTKAL